MKHLEAEYARNLIEASLDPLFTISANCHIMDVNQATVNATDVPREKIIGTDFYKYFTDQEKAKEICNIIFDKGFISDYALTIKDHKFTDVLFNGSVYKDSQGNVLGAVIVGRDVTNQNKISKELYDAYAVAELATANAKEQQLNAENATKVALESLQAKQQFLSNMSHEIRTPLNSILGFTKIVLKTTLSEKQREYLKAIKSSSDSLIVLVDDILDLAKVNAGKMTFETVVFKIYTSIETVMQLFEIKTQEKNILFFKEYDPAIPNFVEGDPIRLNQILLNLVSNAFKFTSEGKITVSAILVREYEDKVKIKFSVADTGIGIELSKMDSIFENFEQAYDGNSRIYGGTGLGLAIVKQLVEAQGGTIEVESAINKGSVFSFILTFMKTLKTADPINEPLLSDTTMVNIKVLVVEDIALNQLLIKTILDDFGFTCNVASNGKLAVELMQKNSYDIVLMDLQMPIMDGFQATKYIREELKSDIPIIALTADVTTVDLAKCTAAGMDDYISKPINELTLYSKMVTILEKIYLPTTIHHNKIKEHCTDLNYLMKITKSNVNVMTEIINVYLQQTPILVASMKESLINKDWTTLNGAVHSIIPSFAVVGLNPNFEKMARKIYNYSHIEGNEEVLSELIINLEKVCDQAYIELEEALKKFEN